MAQLGAAWVCHHQLQGPRGGGWGVYQPSLLGVVDCSHMELWPPAEDEEACQGKGMVTTKTDDNTSNVGTIGS